MAVIASLNVLLKADAAQFYATMNKGQKSLASFSASITQSSRHVFAWAAGIGAAVAGGGIVALVKHSFEAMETTGKLAERLSVTTEELSRLQYAANLTDTETETLNEGLGKMSKILGEVAAGDGEKAGQALKTLGLDIGTLIDKSPAAAFTDIAEAISKTSNPFQRASMAVALFGKTGREMLNTMMLGRSGLKAAGDEADRFGRTVTSLESAKIEEADRSFKRLAATIDGIVQSLTVNLVPVLEVAANAFVSWAVDGVNAAKSVEDAFRGMAFIIAGMMDNLFTELPIRFIKLQQMAMEFTESLPMAARDMWASLTGGTMGPSGNEYMQVGGPSLTKAEEDALAARGMTPALGDSSAFAEGKQRLQDRIDAMRKETTFADRLQKAYEKSDNAAAKRVKETAAAGKGGAYDMAQVYADKAAKEQEAIRKEVDAMLKGSETPMQKYESIYGKLRVWLASGNVSVDEYAQGVRHAREELEKASRVSGLDKLAPALSMSYSSFGKMTQQGPVSSGSALDNIKTNTANTARATAATVKATEENTRQVINLVDKLNFQVIPI